MLCGRNDRRVRVGPSCVRIAGARFVEDVGTDHTRGRAFKVGYKVCRQKFPAKRCRAQENARWRAVYAASVAEERSPNLQPLARGTRSAGPNRGNRRGRPTINESWQPTRSPYNCVIGWFGVHAQQAPAEIDEALGFVGDEAGVELVETVAALHDDSCLAEHGHVFRDGTGGLAGAIGDLGDHELVAAG